ncbi:DUF4145 domain-containing protein [Bradyrhizobium diazoefficiens]|uniref:DUF4145 domain-containing protein n=1 Tax=Bradyrhizobium diazoefficiens TaxID=1355477 RepID=UPI00346D63F0
MEEDEFLKKVRALKALGRAKANQTHHVAFQKELDAMGNDRGYCLLVVSTLENNLDEVIDRHVADFNKEDYDAFFDGNGAAGSLSRKISLLQALKVIGPVTRRNLNIVREIRNAFAHGKIPITFETPEVKALCEELRLINPLDPADRNPDNHIGPTPRDRFHDVVATAMLMLAIHLGLRPAPAGSKFQLGNSLP